VENDFRYSATDLRHSSKLLTAKAVLARLPDVTAETELQRVVAKTSAGGVGYRFDPPQNSRLSCTSNSEPRSRAATLRSELVYVPVNRRLHQPHVFARERSASRGPRQESPILPRSNPFENPQRRLVDSVAPAMKFITLVVLFAAAGTWIQLLVHHDPPAAIEIQPPSTTVEDRVAPTTKTAERPLGGATSSGPIGAIPEANRHMGRVREDHGFARLRGDILSVPGVQALEVAATQSGDHGSALPRLQIAELQAAAGDGPTGPQSLRDDAAVREARRFDGTYETTPSR
jgi:hypothetical protein